MTQVNIAKLIGDGSYEIEVVGESKYRANLRAIAGPGGDDGVDVDALAHVVREADNKFDPNALRVAINQRTVGYLPRETAALVAPAMDRAGVAALQADAHITAGFDGGDYSVWLDGDLDALLVQLVTNPPPAVAKATRWRLPWWGWVLLLVGMLVLCGVLSALPRAFPAG